MRRNIEITYPDGNIHRVTVYRADTTIDGRIVISYLDEEQDCFSEIININGVYYKNPEHHSWEYYTELFRPHDMDASHNIINALPEKMDSYKQENIKEPVTEPIKASASEIVKPPERRVREIKVIVYANAGGSKVHRRPIVPSADGKHYVQLIYNLPSGTSFYEEKLDLDNFKEEFYNTKEPGRYNLAAEDKQQMLDILERQGDVFDISDIKLHQINASNGDLLLVSYSSCDSWKLFFETINAKKLTVDITSIKNSIYPDFLSSALHYLLPLTIDNGYTIKTNGIENEKGNHK